MLFYLLLSNGLNDNVQAAIKKSIEIVERIAKKYNISPALRMTLGISDGDSLWAVRYSSQKNSSTLFYSNREAEFKDQVLVVSEPLDDCEISWIPIDEGKIFHFSQNDSPEIIEIF